MFVLHISDFVYVVEVQRVDLLLKLRLFFVNVDQIVLRGGG